MLEHSNPQYLDLIRKRENWMGLESIAMVVSTRIIITTDRPEMVVHDTLSARTPALSMNIEGVSKQYNTKNWGLRDFTLELRSGVLGLLGPNGAGKSTLMRILATITKATSGRVTWNGTDIAKEPDVLGYLPQDFGVYPNLTVVEFLAYMAAIKGLDSKSAKKRIDELLQVVNLVEAVKRPLGGYSGGMKQRVGIAHFGSPNATWVGAAEIFFVGLFFAYAFFRTGQLRSNRMPTGNHPVIQTHGLTKTYKESNALQNLDLQVPRNSICGFLGPDGAGKSTTIKLLIGMPRARNSWPGPPPQLRCMRLSLWTTAHSLC